MFSIFPFIVHVCSYYVYRLKMRADHMVEAVFHSLINLIQNSAKIMASSGYTACLFVIKVGWVDSNEGRFW